MSAVSTAGEAGEEKPPRVSWWVIGALLALMALSAVAHLSALRRDLPLADIDENYFVDPAVHFAATGDPNPNWFGHPGSTVIYPVAGLIHAWDAVAHDGPILGSSSALSRRYEQHPTPFYVLARLWTITLSVATVPLLFLVGRRAFNARVALIAAAIWAVVPISAHFGRIVRSDSASVCFGLLALWLCLRLFEEPRTRWCVGAGLAVGFAISSRYFMVALLPCLAAAAIVPLRQNPRSAIRAAGIAVGSALGGFVLTTPFFLLDWSTARGSLEVQENASQPTAEGLSRLGNLRWYLGTAIPDTLTWPLVALAVAGVVLAVWRRRALPLLLALFCGTFLVGICLSRLHWQRWLIPILPVLILFGAYTVDLIVRRLAATVKGNDRWATAAACVVITGVLAVHPTMRLIDDIQLVSERSTRSEAREWIVDNAPPGTQIGDDAKNAPVDDVNGYTSRAIDPRNNSLAELQRNGYDYFVTNGLRYGRYASNPDRYPRESAFYLDVACNTRLVALFQPTATHGLPIRIYDLRRQPRMLYDFLCTQRVDS
ncbi:MAG: ArnT family glycosyltransferase [Acidimicrobiia bacterium]